MQIVVSSTTNIITIGQVLYASAIGLVLLLAFGIYLEWDFVIVYSSYFKSAAILNFLILFIFHWYYQDKYESFDGKFEGELVFFNNGIQVGNDFFNINDIQKIEIESDDYYGRIKRSGSNLITSPNLSNGTKNYVNIIFSNSPVHRYVQFQMMDAKEIGNFTQVFEHYIKVGKLDKSMLLSHLINNI